MNQKQKNDEKKFEQFNFKTWGIQTTTKIKKGKYLKYLTYYDQLTIKHDNKNANCAKKRDLLLRLQLILFIKLTEKIPIEPVFSI